jgi:hypothetical protein
MTTTRRTGTPLSAALLLLLLGAPPASAASILDLIALPVTTEAGQSGAFDVIVRNDPASTSNATLAGFSVDLTVPTASGVSFTGMNTSTTSPYIFAGNSSGFLTTTLTPLEAAGNDIAASGGTTLTPGQSFGLAHLTYTVAPNAPAGPVSVTFVGLKGGTSLSDPNFVNLNFTPTNGTITVTPATVPEPCSLVLFTTAGAIVWVAHRRATKGRRFRECETESRVMLGGLPEDGRQRNPGLDER